MLFGLLYAASGCLLNISANRSFDLRKFQLRFATSAINVAWGLHVVTRGIQSMGCRSWSVNTPLAAVLELFAFHAVFCLVRSRMLRRNRNIRLSVILVHLLMSIFASILEPDYTGCYVLNEVGVLKSNVGMDEYQ